MKPTTILIASLLCGLTNLNAFAHDPHVEPSAPFLFFLLDEPPADSSTVT